MTSARTAGGGTSRRTASVARTTRGMRVLLLVAGALVFLAGVQLFVFSSNTARYFAWTIDPPLTAAFLGAAYWASLTFEWTAARAATWAGARIAVPTVFVFTTLTLVATLLHLDRFHLGTEFEAGTRLVTWVWIAIYSGVPLVMLVLIPLQLRVAGADPARTSPLPGWLKALLGVQALGFLALGLALFIAPEDAAGLWPWTLTPLTGRAVGAWVISLGLAAGHALLEGDARRLRPAAVAYVSFAVLEAVALARYPDTVTWTDDSTLIYLAMLISAAVMGVVTLVLARRPAGAPVARRR